jgi:hypothetical protein
MACFNVFMSISAYRIDKNYEISQSQKGFRTPTPKFKAMMANITHCVTEFSVAMIMPVRDIDGRTRVMSQTFYDIRIYCSHIPIPNFREARYGRY